MGALKEHDELTIAFARILYAWQHPEVLVDSVTSHNEAIRFYFNSNPMAYHVLKSLVRTAIETRRRAQMTERERRLDDQRREYEIGRILATADFAAGRSE